MTYATYLVLLLLPLVFLLGVRRGRDDERRSRALADRLAPYRARHAAPPDDFARPWPADDIRAASDERARQMFRDRFPDQRHP